MISVVSMALCAAVTLVALVMAGVFVTPREAWTAAAIVHRAGEVQIPAFLVSESAHQLAAKAAAAAQAQVRPEP